MQKSVRVGVMVVIWLTVWVAGLDAATLDPCELLSRAELEAVIGESITGQEAKDPQNPLGQKMCLYTTASSRLVQIAIIRTEDLSPKVKKHGQTAAKIYHTTKDNLDPMTPVTGVGDDACWGVPGLHILKGEVYLLVSVGNTSRQENLALARKIAEKLIPRL